MAHLRTLSISSRPYSCADVEDVDRRLRRSNRVIFHRILLANAQRAPSFSTSFSELRNRRSRWVLSPRLLHSAARFPSSHRNLLGALRRFRRPCFFPSLWPSGPSPWDRRAGGGGRRRRYRTRPPRSRPAEATPATRERPPAAASPRAAAALRRSCGGRR